METVILKATPRTVIGKQVRAMRRQGLLPGVIYGHNLETRAITMDAHAARLILSHMTASSLVTIDLEGKEFPVLVREKQRDPVKRHLLHVDFQAVSLTEKIRAKVGIVLTGSSPAVKDVDAVLVTVLDQLEVECFPQDLPENITVDISGLAQVGNGIHVRDIVLSDKVRVLDDAGSMIILATAAKIEIIEEAVPAVEAVAGEVAEPEVIEKGKKEEEETSEE